MDTIGIDIGTTHIKVCLYRNGEGILSISSTAHEKQDYNGMKVYDCENLWNKVLQCFYEIGKTQNLSKVTAIGITSMAEAGVPIGENGEALYPIIPWSDSSHSKCEFPEHLKGYSLYKKTGLLWHPKYTLNRLLWFREEKPEVFCQMKCWLSVADYVLYRLTGEFKTEQSLASRTMLYNIITKSWDKELIEFAGVEGRLPEVIEEGVSLPYVHSYLAEQFGISKETTVLIGGHDHLCAAKAEGIENNEILNSMGTSEVFLGFLENPILTKECYNKGVVQGCFWNRYYWMSNLPASGASVEWMRELLSLNEKIEYDIFLKKPKQIPSKVMYFPFLNQGGTHRKQQGLEGGFLGLTTKTTREDVIQGIYDGIALEIRYIFENNQKLNLCNGNKIISVGGGTKNKILMETKANAAGISFYVSDNTQATALGAAILALEAEKEKVVIKQKNKETIIIPKIQYKKEYDEKYYLYCSLYKQLWERETEQNEDICFRKRKELISV